MHSAQEGYWTVVAMEERLPFAWILGKLPYAHILESAKCSCDIFTYVFYNAYKNVKMRASVCYSYYEILKNILYKNLLNFKWMLIEVIDFIAYCILI